MKDSYLNSPSFFQNFPRNFFSNRNNGNHFIERWQGFEWWLCLSPNQSLVTCDLFLIHALKALTCHLNCTTRHVYFDVLKA
jgi:hypothetical protein